MKKDDLAQAKYPIGLFCHSFGPKQYLDGTLELTKQGVIIGMDDDYLLIMLFSWLDGDGNRIEAVPKKQVYTLNEPECWNLYPSKEAMDAFYQKFQLDYGNQEAFEI